LDATHLSACAEYTPCHAATVDDYMTLFELSKYNNHVDHTDLRAELLSLAAATDGWHVKALSPAEYAARIPADALRGCLEILAETDTTLKLRSGDEWVLLEQTVARLTEALR
jgi:DNA polymerase III delta subunit